MDNSGYKDLIERLKEAVRREEEAELKALGKFPLSAYKPYEKQQWFHKDQTPIRIVTGGNSSGKTLMGCAEFIWCILKQHPFKPEWNNRTIPIHGMVVVEDTKQATQHGAAQSKIISMLPEDVVESMKFNRDVLETVYLKNGGSIVVRSAKAGRRSLQGGRFSIVWVDENCIKDSAFYDELLFRLPDDGKICNIIVTATPNLDPLKDFFLDEVLLPRAENLENPDVKLFQVSLFDNPYVEEETKKFLLRNATGDPDQILARMEGEYKKRKGLIYNFNSDIHIIPPISKDYIKENAKAIFRIIDPHPVKPIAVSFIAVMSDGTIVQFDELNEDGLVKDVAERMRRVCDGLGHLIVKTIMDYSGNSSNRTGSGKSVKEEFTAYGIHCVNCVKDLTIGINYVRQMLDDNILKITSNCVSTIREFRMYRENPKTGEPYKKNDEFMDNLRYFACDSDAKFWFLRERKKNGGTVGFRQIVEGGNEQRSRARRKVKENMLGIGVGVGR